jgi:hypothetical protein
MKRTSGGRIRGPSIWTWQGADLSCSRGTDLPVVADITVLFRDLIELVALELCGLLIMEGRLVVRCRPVERTATEKRDRYGGAVQGSAACRCSEARVAHIDD